MLDEYDRERYDRCSLGKKTFFVELFIRQGSLIFLSHRSFLICDGASNLGIEFIPCSSLIIDRIAIFENPDSTTGVKFPKSLVSSNCRPFYSFIISYLVSQLLYVTKNYIN